MNKITRQQRLYYEFDNLMSKGPAALIGWLMLISAVLIVTVSLIVSLGRLDDNQYSFGQLLWMGLMHTLDSGAVGGDTGNWSFLLSMLVISVGGLFVFSILVGILTTGIEGKLEQLRKGRSFVAETGHIVILGWSNQIFTVISELVVANENLPRSCITVLAEKDKVEMEDEIRDRVGKTGRTRIVCRTGNPINLADLAIVNPRASKAVIILAPEDDNPDIQVIKMILALSTQPHDAPDPYHIVGAVNDPKNLEVAQLAGGDEVQLLLIGDLIARIAAQTCRQSGLSVVYTELMNFSGDEIYFYQNPALAGKLFGETLLMFVDSAVMGIQFQDGKVQLNPPMDTQLQPGDKLIVITQDDDTVRLSGLNDYGINTAVLQPGTTTAAIPERTLVLGWNHRAPIIIQELDNYVAGGSAVTVVTENLNGHATEFDHLQHQTFAFHAGDTTDRRTLEELAVQTYQHIIVLSGSDELEAQQADARTLVTLLHLRHIANQHNTSFSIVSEMLDTQNQQLAEIAQADDFIISDELVSLMLAQVAENKDLTAVFQDLFDPEGAELYLKPVSQFVQPGQAMNFYTVVEAARRQGATAIGYRLQAQAYDRSNSYGVKINPVKSQTITFAPEDKIIVLAEF